MRKDLANKEVQRVMCQILYIATPSVEVTISTIVNIEYTQLARRNYYTQ